MKISRNALAQQTAFLLTTLGILSPAEPLQAAALPAIERGIDVVRLTARQTPPSDLLPKTLDARTIKPTPKSESKSDMEAERQEDITVPPLANPLIFIPGNPPRNNHFRFLASRFCEGGNNIFGGYYSVGDEANFELKLKQEIEAYRQIHHRQPGIVTAMKFSKADSVEKQAQQVKPYIDCVNRVTKAKEAMVVAECTGGLVLRKAAQLGLKGIKKNPVLLGTPHAGMWGIGDVISYFCSLKELLGLPIRAVGGFPLNAETLKILWDVRSDFSVGPWSNNPTLRKLNSPKNIKLEAESIGSPIIVADESYPFLEGKLGNGIPLQQLLGDTVVTSLSALGHPKATRIVKHLRQEKNGHGLSNPHKWLRSSEDIFRLILHIATRKEGEPLTLDPEGPFSFAPAKRPPEALAILCACALIPVGIASLAVGILNKFLEWPNGNGWPKQLFMGAVEFETVQIKTA